MGQRQLYASQFRYHTWAGGQHLYDVFEPSAGFKDVGITLNAQYEMAEDWFVTGLFSVGRLVGDAADSPIVMSPGGSENQVMIMLGLSRRF